MRVKCLHNTGKALMNYPRKPLGTSEITQYGILEVGKEYLVMGMLLGEGMLDYLVDDGGIISACPCQLFEVVDAKVNSHWYFRAYTKDDDVYPYREAVWGYYELCFVDDHYDQLIEKEEESHRIYFRRKIEIERELAE